MTPEEWDAMRPGAKERRRAGFLGPMPNATRMAERYQAEKVAAERASAAAEDQRQLTAALTQLVVLNINQKSKGVREAQEGVQAISRADLIAHLKPHWLRIESDISNASKNGLSELAKIEGGWDEGAATKWAKANDKWKEIAAPISLGLASSSKVGTRN